MIESTLRFDDVEDIPGLLPLLWAVQSSRMWSRERSGRPPGNEATCKVLPIAVHFEYKTLLPVYTEAIALHTKALVSQLN